MQANGKLLRAFRTDGSAPPRVLHDLSGTTSFVHDAVHVTDGLGFFLEQRPPIDGGFFYGVLMVVPLDGSSPARQISRFPRQPAGDVSAFTLDPTGTRVAYLADQDERDQVDLYLTGTRGGATPRRLNDPVTMRPVLTTRFRDDGRRLAFVARSGAETVLASVPSDGGAPALAHDRGSFDRYLWTPDGARLVYRRTDASGTAELLSLPGDGSGSPRVLNAPLVPGGTVAAEGLGFVTGQKDFQLSSDSRWVVYVASQDQAGRFELYRVPVDGSAPPVVLSGTLQPGEQVSHFRLTPDARQVVFSVHASGTGTFRVHSVNLNGAPAATQIFVSPSLAELALDGTSRWVVVRELVGSVQLHAIPTGGGALFPLSQPGARVLGFEIAAGSARLVFQTEQQVQPRRVEVFSARLDGAGSPVLLSPAPYGPVDLRDQAFALAPDGTHAALPTSGGLLLVRIEDGAHTLLDPASLVRTAIPSERMRFSDDGTRLVYPREVDGKLRLYWVPTDGSRAPRVANGPLVRGGDVLLSGTRPIALTPGGERVLYLADQEHDEAFELFATTLSGPRTFAR